MTNPFTFLHRRYQSHPPILSFHAEATRFQTQPEQTPFKTLVRHLIHRFLNHELLAAENESKRVLQIAYAAALPTLLVALFLFPAYHAVFPLPHPRPFWSQVGDHYIFVMYAFVLMGLATVYEWDLLFPDLLDVTILSVLPIPARRLFTARVLAVAAFLAVVLVGTSILGTTFFPLLAELPNPLHHLVAHATAVLLSGTFAAATFLALQGILLTLLGERLFRRLGPLFQGLSLLILLAILLLTPTVIGNIEGLLTASTPAVRLYPPFWFLGLYERLLHGPQTPPLFSHLAHTGLFALVIATASVVITYPLAYRRRVRQLIEGESAAKPKRSSTSLNRALHRTLLPHSAHRATFHLASQTVLRSQRHRVTLALFAGLTLALVLSQTLILHVRNGHIHAALLPGGIRAAVPITVFLTVIALRGSVWAPVDRRGAWIFNSILGRPRPTHLSGTKRWITLYAALAGTSMALALHLIAPPALRAPRILLDQLLVALGLAILLTDLYLYPKQSLPFTTLRITSIVDLPLALLRNFVLFPLLLAVTVAYEPTWEQSWLHLAELTLAITLLHLAITRLYTRSLQHLNADILVSDEDAFPQSLGLRDG